MSMEKNERKQKRYEYLILIGFVLIVFFGAFLDSNSMLIPAAGVGIGAMLTTVATWLYYRR